MAKHDEPVKKELPALFCNECREWVTTQEKHNMFASADGVAQAVTVWVCKPCRQKRESA